MLAYLVPVLTRVAQPSSSRIDATGSSASRARGMTRLPSPAFCRRAVGQLSVALVAVVAGSASSEAWASDRPLGGFSASSVSASREIVQLGDTVFFVAQPRLDGPELWRTDGTRAGTKLVKDVDLNRDSYWYGWLKEMDGKLFFT